LGAKLYAFGLAAALAATGGILLAFQTSTVTFEPRFDVFGSISMVVYAVIGGVGAALGGVVGASLAPGAVRAFPFPRLRNNPDGPLPLFGRLLLIVVLLQDANGLVSLYRRLALRLHRWPIRGPTLSLSQNEQVRPPPATLEPQEIT